MTYVEKYANAKGITIEEAMTHAIVKEYLKSHPKEEITKPVDTQIVYGCGSGTVKK